jgi:hypothetical protein
MRFAIVFVFALSLSSQQSQPPSQSPTRSAQTQQDKAATKEAVQHSKKQPTEQSTPNGNKTNRPATTNNEQHGDIQSNDPSSPNHNFLGAKLSDWLIVIFTFFLTVLAGLQFWAMHRQAKYMRDALTETRKAADAARDSADALMNGERAWILVDGIRDFPSFQSNQRELVDIIPVCTNYGKTVGTITRFWYTWSVLPLLDTLPDRPDYADRHGITSDQSTRVTLPPHTPFEPLSRLSATNNNFEHIYKNEFRLWIYGFIEYLDAFDRPPHVTRFCLLYVPFMAGTPYKPGFYVAGPTAYHEST